MERWMSAQPEPADGPAARGALPDGAGAGRSDAARRPPAEPRRPDDARSADRDITSRDTPSGGKPAHQQAAEPASEPTPDQALYEGSLLEALFRQVPVGVSIYDTERRYVRANETMCAFDGLTAAEHVGRRIEETMPGVDHIVLLLQQHVLDTGEPVTNMLTRNSVPGAGSGSDQYWSVSFARLEAPDGRVLGLTGIIADVTERQAALERGRRSRRRAAILHAADNRIGTSLDLDATAGQLAEVAVPSLADAAAVHLLERVLEPAVEPGPAPEGPIRLRLAAHRGTVDGELPDDRDQEGDPLVVEPGSELYELMAGGVALAAAPGPVPAGRELLDPPPDPVVARFLAPDQDGRRVIVAPLTARGVLLGLARFTRSAAREPFRPADLEIVGELATRTAVSLDNALLYLRERTAALLLQRSLVPGNAGPEGTRLAYRYRAGSSGTEVGGDWFDVIALPSYRVAFVIGDVMGSGLHAAGIMSQLRAAARTLARLDLSPAILLRELDEVAKSLSESHIATCIYGVYDPVSGFCSMACAGHLPPLLAVPGGPVETVRLPAGIPLGVGGERFEERAFAVEPGSALVLYTDGLVEDRSRDIDEGIDDLQRVVSKVGPAVPGEPQRARMGLSDGWLERACDAAFESLLGAKPADDATLLVAALDRFPEDRVAAWVLSAQPTVAAGARELVRRQLRDWSALRPGSADIAADTVELLVSELVTNSLRYGRGPIGLRLLRGRDSLVCEVSDELQAAPRPRAVHQGDEGGRGLFLVDQLSRRWGVRTTAHGKIIWFEV
jgi:PAS domain S-box-containing protein